MDPDASLMSVPTEALLSIFSYLAKTDLALVRQTCKKLAAVAAKLYFQTCTTSFLHLDQLLLLASHPELSHHVKQLRFQEMNFDLMYHPDEADYMADNSDFRKLISTILNHHGLYLESPSNGSHPVAPGQGPDLPDCNNFPPSPPRVKEAVLSELFYELIARALEEYKIAHRFQGSIAAFRQIKMALKCLPNLRRLRFCDARDGGIIIDTPFMPRSLKQLNEYFPLSEASLHMVLRNSDTPPYQGFLQVLSAFEDLGRDIDEVVVQHNGGLFVNGVPTMLKEDIPLHLQDLALPAFRRMRKLSLCIHLSNWRFRGVTEDVGGKAFLREALFGATQLESLKLRFEPGEPYLAAYNDIIPMSQTLATLHTLELENVYFDKPLALTEFLLHRLPVLCHLSLRRCTVVGTWEQVFDALSDKEEFILKSIEVSAPCDEQNGLQEVDPNQPVAHVATGRPRETRVPTVVTDEELLSFINKPGAPNPFRSRKWRYFDSWEHAEAVEEGREETMDECDFEDMSDWEQGSDYSKAASFEWEDPDGPEFMSDYDFSGESDSDSDEEGEGPINGGNREDATMVDGV